MSRTATLHNKQPTTVPVSVKQKHTNKHNRGTGTVWRESRAIAGSTETVNGRWFTVDVVLDRL